MPNIGEIDKNLCAFTKVSVQFHVETLKLASVTGHELNSLIRSLIG